MRCKTWGRSLVWIAGLAALMVAPAVAEEECGPGARPKPGAFNPEHESVEMFSAVDEGQIEVKVIMKDEFQGRVFITNKTDQPLNIKLPEVAAAVPVLAQFCPCGGGAGGGAGLGGCAGGTGGTGGQQGAGGGMMGGMGMGMGGMGGGFFNVPAEKVGELAFRSVCLDHGKDSPRPAAKYQIVPLADYTSDPAVAEMLKMYLKGKVSQSVAQAAAWHFCSGMSWEELSAKQLRRATGQRQPYFSAAEINAARHIAGAARAAAENRKPEGRSPGDVVNREEE
jgi:hypothetical protein